MQRILLPLVASVAAVLTAPAAFANYSATPVQAASANFIAKDVLFKCGEDGCLASRASGSRPAIICAAVVKQVGAVSAFSANGASFDADALARCNARAKGAEAQ